MQSKTVAKKIFTDAVEASLPKNFISEYCRLEKDMLYIGSDVYDLSKYKNLYVFGSGKAAFTMAQEMEKLLEEKIYKGLVVAPKTEEKLRFIELCEGSHPIPSEKSLDGAKKLLEMMQESTTDDLFIYLLSGGSSALIELPIEPIRLEEFQKSTQLMLHNALEIHEINVVRKHISQVKGGRLADVCSSRGIVLVLSDIIDDDLYSIGSAPLYADESTYYDAKEILQKKGIFHHMPQTVQDLINKGVDGGIQETPKTPKERIKHYLVASNSLALNAAALSAKRHGLSVKIVDEPMQGDVKEMVAKILQSIKKFEEKCILFGGECTVKVEGSGQGGRNQHAVALMLQEMYAQNLDICFLSAGTDGIDGNSDAAGAVVSKEDFLTIDEKKLSKHIINFDSYNYFRNSESLVIIGPSGTNVIDIAIIIKGE
jgi:glycerate 2-kinase